MYLSTVFSKEMQCIRDSHITVTPNIPFFAFEGSWGRFKVVWVRSLVFASLRFIVAHSAQYIRSTAASPLAPPLPSHLPAKVRHNLHLFGTTNVSTPISTLDPFHPFPSFSGRSKTPTPSPPSPLQIYMIFLYLVYVYIDCLKAGEYGLNA